MPEVHSGIGLNAIVVIQTTGMRASAAAKHRMPYRRISRHNTDDRRAVKAMTAVYAGILSTNVG